MMMYQLMKAYNQEVLEKAMSKLSTNIEDYQPEGLYDVEDVYAFIKELSPAAQEVLGKSVFPPIDNSGYNGKETGRRNH